MEFYAFDILYVLEAVMTSQFDLNFNYQSIKFQVDLHRLNQYIQEAAQREQILEAKLLNIQKKTEVVKLNTANCWKAQVDEERLLSRIDTLENKLMCFSKAITEDKLKEEVQKLHSEKLLYQSSAKDALKKVQWLYFP